MFEVSNSCWRLQRCSCLCSSPFFPRPPSVAAELSWPTELGLGDTQRENRRSVSFPAAVSIPGPQRGYCCCRHATVDRKGAKGREEGGVGPRASTVECLYLRTTEYGWNAARKKSERISLDSARSSKSRVVCELSLWKFMIFVSHQFLYLTHLFGNKSCVFGGPGFFVTCPRNVREKREENRKYRHLSFL